MELLLLVHLPFTANTLHCININKSTGTFLNSYFIHFKQESESYRITSRVFYQ